MKHSTSKFDEMDENFPRWNRNVVQDQNLGAGRTRMGYHYNLKLHEMIEMHSKYDNMHTNEMFYALICINNHFFCLLRLHVIN